MEAEECEKGCYCWAPIQVQELWAKGEPGRRREEPSCEGYKKREREGVQGMMVLGEPEKRMVRVAREEFRNGSESVQIGSEPGADHGHFLPAIERRGSGEKPSGKKVGDRAHGQRTAEERFIAKKSLLQIGRIELIFADLRRAAFWLFALVTYGKLKRNMS